MALYKRYCSCTVTNFGNIFFQLGKLTVAVLKEIVKKEKITASGTKKADLIDAINDHFGV